MKPTSITIALVGLLCVLCACEAEESQPPSASAPATAPAHPAPAPVPPVSRPTSSMHFTDVTAQAGIDMVMTCGKLPSSEILEVNGGGLGLIDHDNDGDLDLFVANGATLDDPEHGPGCRLFENLGNLRFRDVTDQAGIDLHRWATGVAIGDFDGDRLDDIFVACYGPSVLLRNADGGRFVDVSQSAGFMDGPSGGIPKWSTSAAFGDIDNDGDLDLYVCNYLEFDVNKRPPHARYKGVEVMAGPHGLKPQHDILYQNQGDGTFLDITATSGCKPANPAFGLNVVILDMDSDQKQDIVVANDSMPGFYFHNKTAESSAPIFEEIGVVTGIASNIDGANQAAMGIGIADVDGNGLPDKFTTVFSSDTNSLHVNTLSPGGQFFEDRSQQYGLAMISRPFLGWSCGFYDFDHDADEDLFMVNGHVYPQATMQAMDSDYEQVPLLFARDGKRFKRVAAETAGHWLAEKHRDRNAVFGDFDNDGDIDIIIGELNGPIRVLRNERLQVPISDASIQNPKSKIQNPSWLIVELQDNRPDSKNHRGLGSKIELNARDFTGQPVKLTRWLFTGGGFQSSGAPYVHFGLPESIEQISLVMTWPDGSQQRLDNVKPGQHLHVRRTAQ